MHAPVCLCVCVIRIIGGYPGCLRVLRSEHCYDIVIIICTVIIITYVLSSDEIGRFARLRATVLHILYLHNIITLTRGIVSRVFIRTERQRGKPSKRRTLDLTANRKHSSAVLREERRDGETRV